MTHAERLCRDGVRRKTPRRLQKGGHRPPFCLSSVRPGFLARPLAAAAIAAYVGSTQVHRPVTRHSEPIFNVPPVVIATIAVLVLVHALRVLVMTDAEDLQFLLTFAFIPARYAINPIVGGSLPGGFGADIWTFFTYAFIHASLLHIALNVAWLLPFGTALARRFGAWRYIVFMLVVAAAGAFAHLLSHAGAMVPMIGASAAISGAMAAAMRFVFQHRGPIGARRGEANADAYHVPAAPLGATLRDPRFLIFLGVWIGLNALFGLGTISIGEEGQEIAWQAHIGGFFAGLVLFTAFDPVASHGESTSRKAGDAS